MPRAAGRPENGLFIVKLFHGWTSEKNAGQKKVIQRETESPSEGVQRQSTALGSDSG